jgi:hypothetical protein
MYYLIEVTETRNHAYIVEAASEDLAQDAYQEMTEDDLRALDLDGQSSWDSYGWNVQPADPEQLHALDGLQLRRKQRAQRTARGHLAFMDYDELKNYTCTQCHSINISLGDEACPTALKCDERTCSTCCAEENGCCS